MKYHALHYKRYYLSLFVWSRDKINSLFNVQQSNQYIKNLLKVIRKISHLIFWKKHADSSAEFYIFSWNIHRPICVNNNRFAFRARLNSLKISIEFTFEKKNICQLFESFDRIIATKKTAQIIYEAKSKIFIALFFPPIRF